MTRDEHMHKTVVTVKDAMRYKLRKGTLWRQVLMMNELIDAINKVVEASGRWEEKRETIKELCTKDDWINLIEFVSWFDQEEDSGDAAA